MQVMKFAIIAKSLLDDYSCAILLATWSTYVGEISSTQGLPVPTIIIINIAFL